MLLLLLEFLATLATSSEQISIFFPRIIFISIIFIAIVIISQFIKNFGGFNIRDEFFCLFI